MFKYNYYSVPGYREYRHIPSKQQTHNTNRTKRLQTYSSTSTSDSLDDINMDFNPNSNNSSWDNSQPYESYNGVQQQLEHTPTQENDIQLLDALFSAEDGQIFSTPAEYTMEQPVEVVHQQLPPVMYPQQHFLRTDQLPPNAQIIPTIGGHYNVFQQRNIHMHQEQLLQLQPPQPQLHYNETQPATLPSTTQRNKRKSKEIETAKETKLCYTRSGRAVKKNVYINQATQDDESDQAYEPPSAIKTEELDHEVDIKSENQTEQDKPRDKKVKTLKLYGSPTPKKNGLTSRFRGVCWYKRTNKWVVQIKVKGKRKHIGYFSNEEEAAAAYDNALKDLIISQKKELEDQAKTSAKVRIPRRRIFNKLPEDILNETA